MTNTSLLRRRLLVTPFAPAAIALLVACSASDGESETKSDAPSSRVVFVTRDRFQGNKLGGRGGADEKCQASAAAAGLTGSFRAWISTGFENAIDNVPVGGPWHVVGRNEIAFANRAAWEGQPVSSVAYDEFGGVANAVTFWTGTARGGLRDDACGNWDALSAGVVGHGQSHSGWTDVGKQACFYTASLLCYQTN